MSLKVFEAFAGIGAQNSALKRLGIDYEVVGISEWFINALLAYDAIHYGEQEPDDTSYQEKIDYLNKFTFSNDSVKPVEKISSLKEDVINKLYIANKRCKNYGSIKEIEGSDLPEMDLLVYSFPCQDLSTGGKTKGMSKGSGTRSGLLWEVERILKDLAEIGKLPEYLLMENVKAIYAESNKKDLQQWLDFLESIGYKNGSHLVLNATNFGIPQDRNRAFIISHLGTKIDDESLLTYSRKAGSILPFLKMDYKNKTFCKEADLAQLNNTPSREEMWNVNKRENINDSTTVNTITCNMDRSNTAAMFKYSGPKGNTYRLLTSREAFLLMGFTEEEYERILPLELSYRKINKLIGNSIVVNVLTEVFRVMFGDKYKKE